MVYICTSILVLIYYFFFAYCGQSCNPWQLLIRKHGRQKLHIWQNMDGLLLVIFSWFSLNVVNRGSHYINKGWPKKFTAATASTNHKSTWLTKNTCFTGNQWLIFRIWQLHGRGRISTINLFIVTLLTGINNPVFTTITSTSKYRLNVKFRQGGSGNIFPHNRFLQLSDSTSLVSTFLFLNTALSFQG